MIAISLILPAYNEVRVIPTTIRDAVRYFERAAQISPQNARIARNLAGARAALNEG